MLFNTKKNLDIITINNIVIIIKQNISNKFTIT